LELKPPDLVIARLHGTLEPEEVKEMVAEITAFVGVDGWARFLIDLSDLQEIPPRTRIAMVRDGQPYSYSKLVIVGASNRMRVLGSLLLKMLRRIKTAAFFDTEDEALSWLDESS